MITSRSFIGNPQVPVSTGNVFEDASLEEVTDFLISRKIERNIIMPSSLKLEIYEGSLILEYANGEIHQHPVRRSFLHKLLNWFSFPQYPLSRFSPEAIIIIANEILKTIQREVVLVLEDNEALTVLSPKYTLTEDLRVLDICKKFSVNKIYRDDFITRATFAQNINIQPKPGDHIKCGIDFLNSETGFRAFELLAYLFRLVCSNGAVHKVSLGDKNGKYYHHGLDIDIIDGYVQEFSEKLKPFCAQVEMRLRIMGTTSFDPDNELIKKNIAGKLPSFAWKNLLNTFLERKDDKTSMYDFYNHITDYAKRFDAATKLQYEQLAGALTEIII